MKSRDIIVVLILFGIIAGCGPSNEIINLETDLSNSLQVEFSFSTLKRSIVYIEFWETGSSEHFKSQSTKNNTVHQISLLRLKPHTEYNYQFIISSGKKSISSDIYSFRTVNLPDFLPKIDLILDSGQVFNGYLLIRNVQSPGQQLMIDHTGQIVWYHAFDTALFRPFCWTDDQSILALKSDKIIHEFNLKGDIIREFSHKNKDFTELVHHEVLKDAYGNILTLTRNNKAYDLTSMGGFKSDTIKGDGIIIFDSNGTEIWQWDIFEHADPLLDPNIMKSKNDWSHANSLSVDMDGHYLVSFRHFNQIWKIHSQSGEVLWKLGIGGDFPMTSDQYFYLQHAAHINKIGELMLFDNGGPERPSSRALSFSIESGKYHLQTGKVNIMLPDSLFSFKQGSAYLIGEDKVLICSSIKKSIVITDLKGNILWYLKLSESVYRANYVENVDWLRITN